jgi:tellurite resistance protein TerC
LWALFGGVVIGLLALDLFLFHRGPHAVRSRQALVWTFVWIAVAMLFGGFVCMPSDLTGGLNSSPDTS